MKTHETKETEQTKHERDTSGKTERKEQQEATDPKHIPTPEGTRRAHSFARTTRNTEQDFPVCRSQSPLR